MTADEFLSHCPGIHAQWQPILARALGDVDPDYLALLASSSHWLPGMERLFNAFSRDLSSVRYVLIGESPYPRAASANGIAFYDAAVGRIWSETGLSKAVNRATSLRNILKTALYAEGRISTDNEGKISQAAIAAIDKSDMVATLEELFDNLHTAGFLMLNATPVLDTQRKPTQEAKYWIRFLQRLLTLLAETSDQQLTLVLWGKIATSIETMELPANYQKLTSEHPYNISFIQNPTMQRLFRDIAILTKERRPQH